MLRFLSIRRLAVIDSVEVEFAPGFNVLTGETGAGKSILVEAVGLLLGSRASGDLVRTGEDTATIEAVFERGGEEVLVRREITAQGRSRAFVNGDLSTAGALRELSARLIEVHGQHEHYALLDSDTHLTLLDSVGGLQGLRDATAAAFDRFRLAAQELAAARKAVGERASREEFASFQLSELERAAVRAGEDEELAATRQVLASAERIERLCQEGYAALYEQDGAVLASLGGIWRRVGELASIDARFQPYLEARDGIKSQLEDLAGFLRSYGDGIDASPERLQEVEDRLALLERLKRKHGSTLDAVIAKRDALHRELALLAGGEEQITELEGRLATARQAYLAAAEELSATRKARALELARDVEHQLAALAMEQTRFEVRFRPTLSEDQWTPAGFDSAEFYLSSNPGEDVRPLARIVSGGELSRVMLAIKTLAATSRLGFSRAVGRLPSAAAPGLIFDEVDAGIGGRVADIVGRKLRVLGSAFQVLCITHLPQIAACADAHFQIEKTVDGGRTRTSVVKLNERGRVEELSRMLGGAGITEQLRASAREMLAERQASARKAKGEAKPKGESETSGAKDRSTVVRRTPRTNG